MLEGKLEQAEVLLERAAAGSRQSPRIARNLALATALRSDQGEPAVEVGPNARPARQTGAAPGEGAANGWQGRVSAE
jgi:Flp pilus assembly protein TadD